MMKKLIVVVLVSASIAACGTKKADTTPKPVEQPADAMGGAAYGGAAYGDATPEKPAANPCASPTPDK
jgi:hypothetical protein